jgi:hypothetical protein
MRRHWLTILVASTLAYFGVAVAAVLSGLADASQIVASR